VRGGDPAARDQFFSSVAGLYDLNLALNGYPVAVAHLLRRLPVGRDRAPGNARRTPKA
jgi:hypothetical protein